MFKKSLVFTFLLIYSFVYGYSEQVVVSQFDIGLKNSSESGHNYKYSLTGVTTSGGGITSVNSNSLDDTIDFIGTIENVFTGILGDLKYNYSTAEKALIIPVSRNTSATTMSGSFELTETTSSVKNYYIQENFILPAKVITLSQDASANTGVKFTYDGVADKTENYNKYKMQKYMIRIVKSSVSEENSRYDVLGQFNREYQANSINPLTTTPYAQSFIEGNTGYMDFRVTGDQYDKQQKIDTNVGISLKFSPGNIELFGLPKGSYRIELYSFRYSKEITNKGNVVITKEDSKPFNIGEEFTTEGIDIMSFSSAEFKTIKATILTIGNTTNPAITVTEDGTAVTGATVIATDGAIYLDSTSSGGLTIGTAGTLYDSKYYQLWSVVYTTPNPTINTATRAVVYKMNNNQTASTSYNVISSTAQFTNEDLLYQTIFAGFKDSACTVGEFEIDDRYMNKYSNGYRSVRTSNIPLTSSAIDIETLYKGNTSSTPMTNNSSFNWIGNQSGHNSVIISKPISDSKGAFKMISDSAENFTFYTTTWTPNFTYVNESDKNNSDDTVTLKWSSPDKSNYDATLTEEKVIFRIVRSTGSSNDTENYRYKPDSNSNPILESTEDRLSNFMKGTTGFNYFDVIFDSGIDKSNIYGNVIFTFSKANTLKIVGLNAGDYKIQIYSLQDEDSIAKTDDSYDYRVLTYGGPLTIKNDNNEDTEVKIIMKEPSIPKMSYTLETPEYNTETKKVEVGVIINADQLVTLEKSNLVAKKLETSSSSGFYYSTDSALLVEAWNPTYTATNATYSDVRVADPSLISVEKSTKADFQYPLDIVLLIDNSASMQNEIDAVKNGIDNFSKSLEARGYDVKFNLITFGANQTSNTTSYSDGVKGSPINKNNISGYLNDIDTSKYTFLAIFNKTNKWFNNKDDLKNALDNLQGMGGASGGQENGSYALHYGIQHLKDNGRYLNKSYEIVSASASVSERYKPSKKWLIFLTDENMDIDYVPSGYNKNSTIIKQFTTQLEANNINLTGIFHTSFVSDSNTISTYNELNPPTTPSEKILWNFRNTNFEVYTDSKGHYILYNREGNKQYFRNSSGTLISPSTTLNIGTTYKLKDETNTSITPTYIGDNGLRDIKYTGLRYIYDFFSGNGSRPQDFGDVFYTDFALTSNWNTTSKKSLFNMYDMGINGENSQSSLIDSVKDIGIFQRWIVKYTSPYSEKDSTTKKYGEDGKPREVIFSLDNVKSYDSTTESPIYVDLTPYDINGGYATDSGTVVLGNRNYIVPEKKITVTALEPSRAKPVIEKISENGKNIVKLIGQAQSLYTPIGSSIPVNYPIIKGTFIIEGYKSDDGTTKLDPNNNTAKIIVSNDDKDADRVEINEGKNQKDSTDDSVWYIASSEISASDFTKEFGKNPIGIKFTFVAETKDLSDQDTFGITSILDKIPPKITSLKMTNVTLKDFMGELKDSSSTTIFTTDAITSASAVSIEPSSTTDGAITVGSFTDDKKLNVKDKDKIKIEFTVDDENITENSNLGADADKKVKVVYNGTTYYAVYDGVDNSDSNYPDRTKWTVEVDINPDTAEVIANDITIDITDDSTEVRAECNNTTITANAFNQPNLLANTTLKAPTSMDRYTGDASKEYYNTSSLTVNEITDALAYLIVFDYDESVADVGATTEPLTNGYSGTVGNKRWLSSKTGTFDFYNGQHEYDGTVYVINSAGAILGVTHYGTVGSPSGNLLINTAGGATIENVVGAINTSPNIFYVDTVAPVVTSITLTKTTDSINTELNSGIANSILNGLIGEIVTVAGGTDYERPYKNGDNLALTGTIQEKNIGKFTIGGGNIFTDNNLGIITGTAYSKSGVAEDLGSQINENRDVIVYDKAGNKAEYLTDGITLTTKKIQIQIVYDDRIPTALETKVSVVNGVEIKGVVVGDTTATKFTNDSILPLTSTTNGVPLSVVIVEEKNALDNTIGSAYYGDVRKGTGDLKTIVYSSPTDKLYRQKITTYSYSGVKKELAATDRIILDTEVGILESGIILNSVVPKITASKLNEIFRNVYEMVGLDKYSIKPKSSGINDMKLGASNYISDTKEDITGALYYAVSTKPISTTPISGEKEFVFTPSSGGTYEFAITLYDRLGNTKTINYTVEIPNSINIIGKKVNSNLTINTKIDNSTKKMDIKARK